MRDKQGVALKAKRVATTTQEVLTPRSVEITIDHLPARELSPNARLHWWQKADAAKTAREEIGWLSKQFWHDDKPMQRARISYLFHFRDNRKHDLDNLLSACKA